MPSRSSTTPRVDRSLAHHTPLSYPTMGMSEVAVRDARFKELVDLLHSITPEIYSPFNITRAHYESADIQIPADILVPKDVDLSTARPVIVRIHGGFLVCCPWLRQMTSTH